MSINVDAFISALSIMGKGYLGIFIVTGVMILCMTLLNKFTSEKKKDQSEEE